MQKKKTRIDDLNYLCSEFDFTAVEAAHYAISFFFESAGFPYECIEEELSALTDEQIMDYFFNEL